MKNPVGNPMRICGSVAEVVAVVAAALGLVAQHAAAASAPPPDLAQARTRLATMSVPFVPKNAS